MNQESKEKELYMRLIERYLDEVLIRVSFNKRKKVEKQLRKEIADAAGKEFKVQDKNNLSTLKEDQIISILNQFGDPSLYAQKVNKEREGLIKGECLWLYNRTLKVCCAFVLLAIVLQGNYSVRTLLHIVIGLAITYGFVTGVYLILQSIQKKEKSKYERQHGLWSPLQLRYPKVKRPNKRGNYLIGLFLKIYLLCALYLNPEILTIKIYATGQEGKKVVSLLLLEKIVAYRVLFTVLLATSIVYSLLAIWKNRPVFWLMVYKTVYSIVNAIVLLFLFRVPGLWNMNFYEQLESIGDYSISASLLSIQNLSYFSIAGLLFFASILVFHAFYRFFSSV